MTRRCCGDADATVFVHCQLISGSDAKEMHVRRMEISCDLSGQLFVHSAVPIIST
jgi:hypothetical protein